VEVVVVLDPIQTLHCLEVMVLEQVQIQKYLVVLMVETQRLLVLALVVILVVVVLELVVLVVMLEVKELLVLLVVLVVLDMQHQQFFFQQDLHRDQTSLLHSYQFL
tara:strand:+ start:68 stop:385 length:318 start_codon:yes stop_codon:yes gene_type:complete